MRLLAIIVPQPQLFGLFQPLLYLSPVDVVFARHRPLIALAEFVLVVAIYGTKFEIQTVTLPLLQRCDILAITDVFVATGADIIFWRVRWVVKVGFGL